MQPSNEELNSTVTKVPQAKTLVALILSMLAVTAPFLAGTAQAHRRDFPYTNDWRQPSKGEKEFEVKTSYRGRDNQVVQQFELEYGVTERFMVAPYVFFAKNTGDKNLRYTGFKLETRYQLGEFKRNAVLPGLYLEYVNEKGGKHELEGKLILSRYSKKDEDFSFNYIVERELENGAEFENKYSLGYARPLGKGGTRIGAEWIHNLSSGRINAGPTFGFEPFKDIWVVAGAALPVNSRGGNRTELRFLAEYEF